jgi:phage minor structural protein
MNIDNPAWEKINLMKSHVEILENGNRLFRGRIIKPIHAMDGSGLIYQEYSAESIEAYLHDSCQVQQKVSNCTVAQYFQAIISQHNSQVEDYKKFKVGSVTVTDSSGSADRYLDYENTFDAITNRLIDVYGGYITVDYDTMTINYLASVGSKSTTPLRIGFNMKSASKTIDPTSVVTRLIPTGADSSTDSSSTDTSSLTADKQPVTAKTTLANQGYVDNQALIDEFGIIAGTQNFDGVTDTATLQQKAQNWLGSRSAAKESWEISVSNLHLIDKTIDDFKVGNQYQFINDFVAPSEWLQVTELDLDLVTPTNSTIKIGDVNMNLSTYLNNKIKQTQNLQKKISLLSALTASQASTIAKQTAQLGTLGDNYANLSETVQNIIDNNDIWISGQVFIDVSQYQSDTSVAWFTKCISAGAKGIMVKLTDGSSGDDNNALAGSQLANSATAGLKLVGCYHYLENIANATSEANNFLAQLQANNIDKSKIVALDVEGNVLSNSKSDLDSAITTFLKVLTDAGYVNTCLYGSSSRFGTSFDGSLAKLKWIADWDSSTKPDGADGWQFSNGWQGYGVDASYSYSKAFI